MNIKMSKRHAEKSAERFNSSTWAEIPPHNPKRLARTSRERGPKPHVNLSPKRKRYFELGRSSKQASVGICPGLSTPRLLSAQGPEGLYAGGSPRIQGKPLLMAQTTRPPTFFPPRQVQKRRIEGSTLAAQ